MAAPSIESSASSRPTQVGHSGIASRSARGNMIELCRSRLGGAGTLLLVSCLLIAAILQLRLFRACGFGRRGRFLARLLEQETQRFLRPDVPRDTRQRAILLELRTRYRRSLALLLGDLLHFAVDLFLRRADSLALGNLI